MDNAEFAALLGVLIKVFGVVLVALLGFIAFSIIRPAKRRKSWKKQYPDDKPQAFYSDRR